jgi:hypothetical protein
MRGAAWSAGSAVGAAYPFPHGHHPGRPGRIGEPPHPESEPQRRREALGAPRTERSIREALSPVPVHASERPAINYASGLIAEGG